MKRNILISLAVALVLTVIYVAIILMDAVTTYSNGHSELIRGAAMLFNLCVLLISFGGGILLVFYTCTKTVTKVKALS